ncbi:hypothetical protein [Streptomyces mirabilis]|uniref:hypothetical protein n=1 Tax=Streptomyces mirabilis TaxID=68239 RepID=UPI00331DCBD0
MSSVQVGLKYGSTQPGAELAGQSSQRGASSFTSSMPEVPKLAVAIVVLLASTVAVTDQPRPMVSLPVPFHCVVTRPHRSAYGGLEPFTSQYAVERASVK